MHPQCATARLPLIDEYDGLCHASAPPIGAPSPLRFRYCNHGYSRGSCEYFPTGDPKSCTRYNVVRRTATTLEVLCIEEQDYAPLRWQSVQYWFEGDRIDPELTDLCMRAQLLAFCHSYLNRFSD